MQSDASNDNTGMGGAPAFDPYGQAALLLVESLIHGLIARDVITVADAVEIVDVAAEVKADIAYDSGDSSADLRLSLDLLATISSSLRCDIPEG